MEKGNLSINSENILPIIKKWLYSDKDIFLRELVSNASDAITKLKKLISMGEASIPDDTDFNIRVLLNEENKTIQVIDNGIGMTADEIKEYINQIAFSGAEAFLNKYKDKLEKDSEIIGHFGLGFYSAFMVADKVEIETLSYKEDAVAAKWVCTGGIDYEMDESDYNLRGTIITLHIGEDSKEFLNEYKLKEILRKYCAFMPIEIYFENESSDKNESLDSDTIDEDSINEDLIKPINDVNPLWTVQPKDCSDSDYKDFYHKVFMDINDPLFWIHLNMDYPFRLKGILYFPKLKHELETIEGQVKLYNNQVFVADNIKEVIPEFLLLLKGTIDCPDLPLNVSRSFLQNDGYAKKMSSYITKKVADKLNSLYKNDKESYEKFWDDISSFIKYGCMREKTFYEKAKDIILFKTTSGDYISLKEYLERNKEKHENKVFYITNEKQQAQYIKLFKDNDLEAIELTTNLDTPFISFLEMNEQGVAFTRIDSDISEGLKDKDDGNGNDKNVQEELQNIFQKAIKDDKLKIDVQKIKSPSISAMMLLSEQARRMQEMSRMFGGMQNIDGLFAEADITLVLNSNNELIQKILEIKDNPEKSDDLYMIAEHVYDLALMSHQPLKPDEMTRFLERSNKILMRLT